MLSCSGQQTADGAVPPCSSPNEHVMGVFSKVSFSMNVSTTVRVASMHFHALNYYQRQVLYTPNKASTIFYCVQPTELYFSGAILYHNLCISLGILNNPKKLAANSILLFHPVLIYIFVPNISVLFESHWHYCLSGTNSDDLQIHLFFVLWSQ